MTLTSPSRRARRNAKSAAFGAVALSAAVALPALAIDRGGDGSALVEPAAASAAPSTTTSTTIDPAVLAAQEAALAAQQQAEREAWLAWVETQSVEDQFDLKYFFSTPEDRQAIEDFVNQQAYLTALDQLNHFLQGKAEAARQAKAAKAAAAKSAAAKSAKASAPRVSTQSAASVSGGSVWDSLAQCETGGNWSHPTVSGGFSGGLMFHSATWNASGGQAYAPTAAQATREQQIDIAQRVLASSGWGAWPGCSRKLGLR